MGCPDGIRHEGSGYRLAIEPAAVDVHRFADLVRRAREETDRERTLGRCEEALGLWRGEPLADVGSATWVAAEVARLLDLRLAAHARRAELLLDLGRHEGLAGELEPLVAADPLREDLAAALMVWRLIAATARAVAAISLRKCGGSRPRRAQPTRCSQRTGAPSPA